MTFTPAQQAELRDLVDAVCEGERSVAVVDRLESMLLVDDGACRYYLDYFSVHGSLLLAAEPADGEGLSELSRGLGTSVPSEIGSGAATDECGTKDDDLSAIPPIIIDTSPALSSPAVALLFAPGSWLFSYAAATLIVGAAVLGAWVYKVSLDSEFTLNQPRPVLHEEKPELTFVGRITGMADCRWAGTPAASRDTSVPLGREFALASGLLEISYQTGAKVILQGPCTYAVDSRDSGFLSLGKLTARVETKGEGGRGKAEGTDDQNSEIGNQKSPFPLPPSPFVVRTPTAIVTDLGTEFGVDVDRQGLTRTRVFVGSIRITAAAGEAAGGGGRVLHAGQAGSVGRGNPAINVAEAGHADAGGKPFARVMPGPKSMRESDAYAALVLSLQPAAYYRMEQPKTEKDRFVVFDSAPGGHHGELRLANEYGGSPYRPGRFGDALWLRGPEAADHVIVLDYPKTANDRLTVSAWVMAMGRPGWVMIASNWGTVHDGRTDTGQFHLGLHGRDGDLSGVVAQRDGQVVETREGASQPLPMFVWQHVALVADGTTLHLYRNGKEVASSPCAGVLPQPPVAALGVGCRTNQAGTEANLQTPPGYDFWQGRIDELAIFNQALSAQQVKQLYLGEPAPNRQAGKVVGTRRVPSAMPSTQPAPDQLPLASDIPDKDKDGTRRLPATRKGDEPMNGP